MTIKELKQILNNVDRGVIRDRGSYSLLKRVQIEYNTDGGITVYFDFENEVVIEEE